MSTQTAPAASVAISTLFKQQQPRSLALRYEPVSQRILRLKKLKGWIQTHQLDIQQAIYQDFKKPTFETDTSEVLVCLQEVDFAIKNLSRWARDQRVSTPITLPGTTGFVRYEPKGVCLIMAPWNYPFQLLVGPWISAIAAGNCAILKPSEMTPHTASLIERMVGELFPISEAAVVQGDKEVAQNLLSYPFDHIFFTGSPAVGKHVMTAAARHLSSVTLELGGKSPAIVDESADLATAAEKIAWGKFFNGGQTCIAPDYVLVHESVHDELAGRLTTAVRKMYNPDGRGMEHSPDFARLVNRAHTERLLEMLNQGVSGGANVVFGGEHSVEEHYLAPTVLTNVPEDSGLMQEEIFGPLLPIRPYQKLSEVIDYVNSKPKPLTLYMFTQDNANRKHVLQRTSSGGAAINECIMQFSHPYLPFGGVNYSGIGKAGGHHGFLAFTNEKSVFRQRWGNQITRFLFPPVSHQVKKRLGWVIRNF